MKEFVSGFEAAFPQSYGAEDIVKHNIPVGMSIRDYFAAAALTGMLAGGGGQLTLKGAAKFSYELADAMLEARKL